MFALVGVRYPECMLPVLVFEVTWKILWLAVMALPKWRSDTLDDATITQVASSAWVVIIIAVIPCYLVRQAAAVRWRTR